MNINCKIKAKSWYNPRRERFSKNTIQTSRKGQNRSTGLYGRLRGICQKSHF